MNEDYKELYEQFRDDYYSLLTLYKALLVKSAIQQQEITVLTNSNEQSRSALGIIRQSIS